MGKSKDLATGASTLYQTQTTSDTRYANVAGDTFTGNVAHTGTLTTNSDIIANSHVRLYRTNDQASQWYFYNHTDDTLRFNYNGAGSDEIILDSSGRMRVPNTPCFGASGYSGTTTQLGGYNPLLWSNVHTNIGNCWNNSTGKFTFPVSGRYHYFCNVNLKAADANWMGLYLVYNGTGQINSWSRNSANTDYNDTIISGVTDASANDYMAFCWHNSYVSPVQNNSSYNYASIHLIG